MTANWSFFFGEVYGGTVPYEQAHEIARLRLLFREHIHGPYDEAKTKLGVAFRVEGSDRFVTMKHRGIKLDPFRNNFMSASIYVRQEEWNVPLAVFRVFLWKNVENAIWACVERLKREKIQLDEVKLKHHLSLVQSAFFGDETNQEESTSVPEVQALPLTEPGDDEDERLVVQYRIEGHGTVSDHDKRVAVENLLGEFLDEAGLGYCDGGDIGSETMNIFCFLKPGKKSGEKIIEALRKNRMLEGAIVVETIKDEDNVIWPPDFKGEFQLI